MTEETLEAIISRVSDGEGVEAILKSMGIDSLIGTLELKSHPSAKGRIAEAKRQGKESRKRVAEAVQQ